MLKYVRKEKETRPDMVFLEKSILDEISMLTNFSFLFSYHSDCTILYDTYNIHILRLSRADVNPVDSCIYF